jgi:hypothetical protein
MDDLIYRSTLRSKRVVHNVLPVEKRVSTLNDPIRTSWQDSHGALSFTLGILQETPRLITYGEFPDRYCCTNELIIDLHAVTALFPHQHSQCDVLADVMRLRNFTKDAVATTSLNYDCLYSYTSTMLVVIHCIRYILYTLVFWSWHSSRLQVHHPRTICLLLIQVSCQVFYIYFKISLFTGL